MGGEYLPLPGPPHPPTAPQCLPGLAHPQSVSPGDGLREAQGDCGPVSAMLEEEVGSPHGLMD